MKRQILLFLILFANFALSYGQYAVVSLSVASLYTKARYTSGVSTQALMGTPLKVIKKDNYWYHVQTPEGYKGWITEGSIELMCSEDFNTWKSSSRLIITSYRAIIYKNYQKSEIISDGSMGNIIQYSASESNDKYYRVIMPCGEKGWLRKVHCRILNKWVKSRTPEPKNIIRIAKQFLGFPYLWGGTSVYGMDCSGFTKIVFLLNGIILPRDSWQQAKIGDAIDVSKSLDNLKMGDFLFFGKKANGNQKENIVHVGLYLENGEFIHSATKIRINSLLSKNADHYTEHSLVKARRIVGNQDKCNNIVSLSNHHMYFN